MREASGFPWSSGALIRLATARTPARRAARTLATAVLRHARSAARRGAGQISGIALSYGPATRRVPDIALHGGGRLHEALRAGRFVEISPLGTETPLAVPDALRVHWRPGSPIGTPSSSAPTATPPPPTSPSADRPQPSSTCRR
ncbi:hypothetical protein [Streptomyces sp. NPDC060194]|uniref:hypothetical protein n=1 Tax=Streptomyces sp. NPDC060194 TaxID=3347069 RepID=UPI0036653BF7